MKICEFGVKEQNIRKIQVFRGFRLEERELGGEKVSRYEWKGMEGYRG